MPTSTRGTDRRAGVVAEEVVTEEARQLDMSASTRRSVVEVYVPQDPHQGAPVVFGYTYVTRTRTLYS